MTANDLSFSYDINTRNDLSFSYDICIKKDLTFTYSLLNGGNDDDAVLLVHFNNDLNDIALGHSEEHTPSNYGVTLNTTVKKFGAASGAFVRASNQYISYPYSADFQFGAGNFTIETWVRFASPIPSQVLVSGKDSGGTGNRWELMYQAGVPGHLRFFVGWGGSYPVDLWAVWTPVVNTFYEIALVRDGSIGRLFVNGTLLTTTGSDFGSYVMEDYNGPLYVGAHNVGSVSGCLSGYMDELRISKSARYTVNFTPQTDEFATYYTKSFTFTYDMGNNSQLTFSYDINVQNDLTFSYDINVQNDLTFSYDINVQNDLTFSYDIGTFGSLAFSYDINVGKDFAFSYDINVQNDFAFSYDLIGGCGDFPFSYNINMQKDLAFSYNLGIEPVPLVSNFIVGKCTPLVSAADINVDITQGSVFTLTTGESAILNATGVTTAGVILVFIIAYGGSHTITFGTNFVTIGTIAGTVGQKATAIFVSDGSRWIEHATPVPI